MKTTKPAKPLPAILKILTKPLRIKIPLKVAAAVAAINNLSLAA